MRIIFIGTVTLSKNIFKKLINLKRNIVTVLTKKESTFHADFADLSETCKKNNIEYKFIDNINDEEVINYIKSKLPDIIFCFGWSQLLKEELLDIPRLGAIGFHPALLPQNRGRHPLIWALALGLEETGSTFFFLDAGADSGDILSQKRVKIDYYDNARSLYDKITDVALKQIEEFIPLLENNTYQRTKQDESKTNYWRKRGEKDGKIDWRMSSYSIYNLVRALTKPYVGAHFVYKESKIKVWKVEEFKNNCYKNIEPGKVIEVYPDSTFLVKAGKDCIKVLDCVLDVTIEKGEYL